MVNTYPLPTAGGEQRSVVVLSRFPLGCVLKPLSQYVGPLVFACGPQVMVQGRAACHWSRATCHWRLARQCSRSLSDPACDATCQQGADWGWIVGGGLCSFAQMHAPAHQLSL